MDTVVEWGSSISWVDIISLLVLPVLLPALVGWLTKATLPGFWKRLFLALATLVTAFLTQLVTAATQGVALEAGPIVVAWVISYAVAELAYHGFYKKPLEQVPVVPVTSHLTSTEIVEVAPARTIASILANSGVK